MRNKIQKWCKTAFFLGVVAPTVLTVSCVLDIMETVNPSQKELRRRERIERRKQRREAAAQVPHA